MASSLMKFLLLLVLYQITKISSLPLMDGTQAIETRVKRFPANNFQLGIGAITPFTVKNPITSLRGSINHFANILRPRSRPHDEYSNMDPVPISQHNEDTLGINMSNDKINSHHIYNNRDVLGTNGGPQNEDIKKHEITEKKQINAIESKQVVAQTTTYDTKTLPPEDSQNNIENITQSNLSNQTKTGSVRKLDKNLLDYIFLSDKETTTIEYTTEYGDYETTTYEEDALLRIPANVVASLLG